MAPIVSIIIPVFNRPALVAEAIESVLAQSNPNWELIVVDDGSADNTWEVLESFAAKDERIKIFKRDREPKGAPTCRNIGAGLAKGEYLIFFDSDDLLLPHCVQGRLKAYNENPEMDFLVFPMAVKNKRGEFIEKKIPKCESYLSEFLSYRLHWGIMCPIWKKEFFQRLGGFIENLPRLNDPEFMIRAFLRKSVKFFVYKDSPYDSIYSEDISKLPNLSGKIYSSFKIFIPSITFELQANGMGGYKNQLLSYLRDWFTNIFLPLETSRIGQSIKLSFIFYKNGILSFPSFLKTILTLISYSFFNFFNYRLKRIMLANLSK